MHIVHIQWHLGGRIQWSGGHMKKVRDFSKGRRGPVIQSAGKTRITIFLDDAIVAHFRTLSERTGKGYQTLINEVLAAQVNGAEKPLTQSALRRIVREELARRSGSENR
jgi:uncharacterized protein (DUF4415 family)